MRSSNVLDDYISSFEKYFIIIYLTINSSMIYSNMKPDKFKSFEK